MRLKRFNKIERLFHVGLMITFLIQAATGFSRLYIITSWGTRLSNLFGGYEATLKIHFWVGMIMTAGFGVHVLYLLTKIKWDNLKDSIIGPDSIVPNHRDGIHMIQRGLWFFGLGSPPKIDRWAYWEKFDYWAVFWGMPLLAMTGVMLKYPLLTTKILPGWFLNVFAIVHRAEAILAAAFIFFVHLFVGHLRPAIFPMSDAMFSGSVHLKEVEEEKPAWFERLKKEDRLEENVVKPPAFWFKVVYHFFGLSALGFGVYLLVNGIYYSRYIRLH
ncbi:MAG: cytochrome b/b6 domain-containing protein [Candidatus Adiutricales bacterium]